ncbi:glutamine--tRNA ligase/YqeY domain fusion protein [Aquabacterium sp. OR-4]|uniref:glutamine--tRNA ligase/YqeY domain fusion protein n=1 Tax=Aquabacterium sp. OR-4 TaxID=2978127 RepID=UPI0028CAD629|nr:glutamine--tRNA ligase/YqeY domain fusion protein [Aquabacterium sp. OR-4]MDT7835208.1 glutamine--tRNA ligase/YqeY domain fusion protein [Aquabacterium sp. OR-4]
MSATDSAPKPANFLRTLIERELQDGVYAQRQWGGTPGDAAHHQAGPADPAAVRLRFPPEPNGYLHIGHAKSICLNFGLARDHGGVCHLRFDDTNPEKEEQEYVDAIIEMVRWLGWDWNFQGTEHLYWASGYFDFMYRAAERLIERGLAYVDEQTPEAMRANRGDFTTPGTDSPFRSRSVAENLARFREMRDGKHADGAMVLRARIDMASPNINLRDPALYRIKHAHHHATGDQWCIYPMYTYAHPIEDALENITHSICTLEFEDQRPFYDWLLARLSEPATLADGRQLPGLLNAPAPKQHEFGRLNLTYVVTSKRKLKALVDDGHVQGWDDPRMPTLAGLRRRGYTPAAIRKMAEDTGASKSNIWIDYSVLEGTLRADLEGQAARAMAVIDPLPLTLTNWAELYGAEHREPCGAPAHPQLPELGQRSFSLGPELWIDRDDFAEVPPKGFFRLYPPRSDAAGVTTPGNKVRLKYGMVVECTGCEKDADGRVTRVLASVVPDTKSGTPGADAVKVKGTITWVGRHDGIAAELRLFDRLFTLAQPDAGDGNYLDALNPASKTVVTGYVEPSLAVAPADTRLQFERHGYFVTDRKDHQAGAPVFNRITTLKDSWGK